MLKPLRTAAAAAAFVLAASAGLPAQAALTTPRPKLGHDIGDDYWLANYKQLPAYWEKLAKESDRMKLVNIGKTEEGRPQLMAIVTSPGQPRGSSTAIRRSPAGSRWPKASTRPRRRSSPREGKAVVWIDGGLHASETLCAQVLIETVYQLVSGDDAETLRILDDVHHPLRPRQSGRHGPRRRLVHARAGPEEAHRSAACRGSTRSTSATTTTATSTPTRRPRRRT